MKINDVPKSILEWMKQLDKDNSPWPAPETLARPLAPVLKFDAKKLLPPVLNAFCTDVAYRMQCPIDFVAVAAVSMLGSVIGTGCAVRPKQNDNWTEVPNLWGGVVGRPGQLKTPAISAGSAPLRSLEHEARKAFEADMAAYNLTEMTRKLQLDLHKNSMKKKPVMTQADLDLLRDLSEPAGDGPRVRRYRSNDSTVEKLGEILTQNKRGLMVFRDELVGLLKSFEQHGREADRGFYLEAWNGQYSYQVDRIGRGELTIPHLCVSVFGGIQPGKLQEYLYQIKIGGNDGLLQRFQLLIYPNELENPKIIDEAPNRVVAETLGHIVRWLAQTDFSKIGAKLDGEDGIPYVRFETKKAQLLFFKWLAAHEKKAGGEDDPFIQEHFAKYRGLIPSLALIFHLFECGAKNKKTVTNISLKSLRQAIAWAEYLASHAHRIYSLGLDFDLLAAATLARKIEARELVDGFTERVVQRKEWATLNDAELVRHACMELEAAGWIRRQPPKKSATGRKPGAAYDINPRIWTK